MEKTPGVFIEEIPLFPPSVASVATALPAFIGHTEITTHSDGQSLLNRPIRITSLLDYTVLFGDAFEPAAYNISLNPAQNHAIVSVTTQNGDRYYLYDCLRMYFDNGGGPCYIVSVGDYQTAIDYGSATTGLRGGLAAVAQIDEPTLLVIPDAVGLRLPDDSVNFTQIGTLQADMLAQCNKLQDRFAIFDIAAGDRSPSDALDPIGQFRTAVGNNNLKYGAVYYPWLRSTTVRPIHFQQFNFTDDATPANPIPDATIDGLSSDSNINALVSALRSALANEQNLFGKIAVTTLNRQTFDANTQFDEFLAAVMAAGNAATVRPAFSDLVSFVREIALALADLENDAGIPAELVTALAGLEADTALRDQITALIGFEKNTHVMNSISVTRQESNVETDFSLLDTQEWINGATVASIAADSTDFSNGGGNSIAQTAQAAANSSQLRVPFDAIAQAYSSLADLIIFMTDQAESNLFSGHPFFTSLVEKIRRDMSILPPSGAVAGIYAATDRSRGVWKAPANVSMRAVISPAYRLTDREQGSLNVHETGKSINAIRAFTGKGILVWGARTLAGNDNEWRYVNVRRFFNYVEESVKKASEPFVFENNDANTWVRIRAMIENFLTLQWRQGALAGATPKQAFFVKVGLGETMSPQDILEGRLIVEIGMAAVRPAEFIILRFSHKMQES